MLIIVTQQTWRDPTELERIWGNSSFYCYVSKVMLHWLLSSMILMCSYMTLYIQIYQIVRTSYLFIFFFCEILSDLDAQTLLTQTLNQPQAKEYRVHFSFLIRLFSKDIQGSGTEASVLFSTFIWLWSWKHVY